MGVKDVILGRKDRMRKYNKAWDIFVLFESSVWINSFVGIYLLFENGLGRDKVRKVG